jgi:hypothetical protein
MGRKAPFLLAFVLLAAILPNARAEFYAGNRTGDLPDTYKLQGFANGGATRT